MKVLRHAWFAISCCALIAFFAWGGWRFVEEGGPYVPPAASPAPSSAKKHVDAAKLSRLVAPKGSTRVLLLGNSTAYYIGSSFSAIPNLAVLDQAVTACTFPQEIVGQEIALPGGDDLARLPCDPAWEAQVVSAFQPAIVFWLDDDPPRGGGTYHGQAISPCSTTYDALYGRDLEREITRLRRGGATVVVTTSAYSGIAGHGDNGADDCQNRMKRSAAARAGARLVDLASYVCPRGKCLTKIDGAVLRPDGFHYSGPGGRLVAQWLMGQVG